MFTIPSEVFATFKCNYCNNLPTRAPVYLQRRRRQAVNEGNNSTDDNTTFDTDHAEHVDDDMIVCAECSVFISADHAEQRNQLVRLQKLEALIPYLRVNLSPPPTPGSDSFGPTLCSIPTSPVSLSSPLGTSTTEIFEPPGKDLKVELSCFLKGNKTTKKATVLQYSMGIESGSGKQLCLVDHNQLNHHSNPYRGGSSLPSLYPVDIHIEGAIALMKKPEQVYANVELTPKAMPIYETIPTLRHSSLKMSNNNLPPMQEQHTTCQNGCLWRGSIADLGEHHKTCPMVQMGCFFDGCTWKGSEQLMKGHLFNKHKECIRGSIEGDFGWQDKFIVMIQSGIIFLFKYFFYEDLDYAEIMVQAVVNRTEMNYKYNVHVFTSHRGQKVRLKTTTARCMVFNKCVLQKGLQFYADDLYDFQNVSYNVDISKIL